jgi:hypothetical protein
LRFRRAGRFVKLCGEFGHGLVKHWADSSNGRPATIHGGVYLIEQ